MPRMPGHDIIYRILTDNGKLKFESFIGVSTDLLSANAFSVMPGPVNRVGL